MSEPKNKTTLDLPVRDPNYVVPPPDLKKNELTLAERMRLNEVMKLRQITRDEAIAVSYASGEIDRLLPAPPPPLVPTVAPASLEGTP